MPRASTAVRTFQEVLKAGQAGFIDHLGAHGPRRLAAIPAFYRRHAEIDRPLANRMRQIQTRREKKLQFLKQRIGNPAGATRGGHLRQQHWEAKRAHEAAQDRRQRTRAQQEELRNRQNGEPVRRNHKRERLRDKEPR